MKPPSTPQRTGARRAAWAASVVALACAVPLALQATPSADAAPLVAKKDDAACVPPVPGSVPTVTPTPTPTPTADPTATATATGNATGNATANATGNASGNAGTDTSSTWPITSVRINQANLKAGTPIKKFKKDLAKVFAERPDFVSYNEVPQRQDALLAPTGYSIFRTPGQYPGEVPVVWRTDRWVAINKGTTVISNKKGILKGQRVAWGIRYANWVTVRSLDGCQTVSMVSTHIAPINKITKNLMGPSMRNLGALVSGLSVDGPVFVGGDFNRHYKSKLYPRAQLTAAGLTASYDLAGFYLPTGDHGGHTVDYVMVRPAASFSVLEQTTTELASDHDLLSVVVSMPARTVGEKPVSFAPGTSVNDPGSPAKVSRVSIKRTIMRATTYTTDGAQIRVSTARLKDKRLSRRLRGAVRRGVSVKVVSGSTSPSGAERALVRALGTSRHADSWIVFRPGKVARHKVTTTFLADRAGATQNLVLTATQPLDGTLRRLPAQARIATSGKTYKAQVTAFRKLSRGR